MARAKTASFTLTQDLDIDPAGVALATMTIGSLIDVGDAQALEIEKVDWTFTAHYQTASAEYWSALGSGLDQDSQFLVQLLDKIATDTIKPSDNNLISSAQCHYDSQNIVTAAGDFYPDDFKNSTGRFVVNDEMYLVCRFAGGWATNYTGTVTCRITAKIVKLTTRDWMAISLETIQNE